jgi:hypothetical protein
MRCVFIALLVISVAAFANTPGSNPVPPRPSVDNVPGVMPVPPLPTVDNAPAAAPLQLNNYSQQDPEPPIPLAPLDGDTTVWMTPLLMVQPYPGFVWYHFCVWDRGNKVAENTTLLPFWLVRQGSINLLAGMPYTWSCQVWYLGHWTAWFDPPWTFSLAYPSQPPTLLSPSDGARINTLTPLLSVVPQAVGGRFDFLIEQPGTPIRLEHETRLPFWRVPEGAGYLRPGITYHWSCRVDNGGWSRFCSPWSFTTTDPGSIQGSASGASAFACQAFPDPFKTRTVINYSLPEAANVTVTFYTAQGALVSDLRLGFVAAGSHRLTWNGKDEHGRSVARGIYVYRLRAGSNQFISKLTKTD